MFDLSTVQAALRDQQLDVRLLCGFRGLNVFAARVAGTSPEPSRRWAYHPGARLALAIESASFDKQPGDDKTINLKWRSAAVIGSTDASSLQPIAPSLQN